MVVDLAANKVTGIRAAVATIVTVARYARAHGANVLSLGSTLVQPQHALEIVDVCEYEDERARYIRRLAKIRALEE